MGKQLLAHVNPVEEIFEYILFAVQYVCTYVYIYIYICIGQLRQMYKFRTKKIFYFSNVDDKFSIGLLLLLEIISKMEVFSLKKADKENPKSKKQLLYRLTSATQNKINK